MTAHPHEHEKHEPDQGEGRLEAPAEEAPALAALLENRIAGARLKEEVKELLAETLGGAESSGTAATGRVYLDRLSVSGFRGIGRKAWLDLTPTPGVTLVVGRNGSGKSSFAEAAEVALTGENARWSGKSSGDAARRKHWRNLHDGQDPQVEVKLHINGDPGRSTLTRTWPGDDVAASEATFHRSGNGAQAYADLGWNEALSHYRPFLTYSELEGIIGGKPSEMYDAVATILGLGRLTEANNRLADEEKVLNAALKEAENELPHLCKMLGDLDDARAAAALAALDAKGTERIEQVAALVRGLPSADGAELAQLRKAASLTGPDLAAVGPAVDRLREAVAALDDVRASGADDAHQRAELLAQALQHADRHPADADCPVCGATNRLDEAWARRADEQLARLRAEARAAEAAHAGMRRAVDEVRYLVAQPPAHLPESLRGVWEEWASCREVTDPAELASRAEGTALVLADACRAVREDAARRLEKLDEGWRQAVGRLSGWLDRMRAAEAGKPRRSAIKAARRWLNEVAEELRQERLRPFADRSQWIWEQLRQRSNVSLHNLELKGSNKAPQRKLLMDVSVDDMEAAALGVMSQGELHSLALSLFLPRATAPESPFGFVVIDDPVQSMDPAKVHGLATVLHELGTTRQVVVFTHDTRLQQAFRDQLLPATVLTVQRAERSRVKVERADDPIRQAVEEARALASTPDLPEGTLAHVLPGICRTALEHAFVEAARQRLHRDGLGPHEVDEAVNEAEVALKKAALGLFGDVSRTGEVERELRARCGPDAWSTYQLCRRGAHGLARLPQQPHRFIDRVEAIAKEVRKP